MANGYPDGSDSVFPQGHNPGSDFNTGMDFLEQFAPVLKQFRGIIREAFGDALTEQFGSTSLLTSQNVGMNFIHAQQMSAADASIRGAVAAGVDSRRQFQTDVINTFGHAGFDAAGNRIALDANEVDRFVNSPMSLQGLVSGRVYDMMMDTDNFNRGLREGNQYMGVGYSPRDPDNQASITREASLIAEAASTAFLNKDNNAFAGLGGKDTGRLYAEFSRTGRFNPARERYRAEKAALGDDADPDDLADIEARMTGETTRLVEQATHSVAAFRRFFKGSLTDILDEVNGLMGVDVMATFQGAEENMMQKMEATGMVAGLGTGRMLDLAGRSRGYLTAAGHDPLGSVAAATMAGRMLGVHANTKDDAFINPERLRDTFVMKATQAGQSRIATATAGALALLQESGNAKALTDFNEQRAAGGGAFTSIEGIAGLTADLLGLGEGGVTGSELNSLGNTSAGRRLQQAGVGMQVSLDKSARIARGGRLQTLGSLLQNSGLSEDAQAAAFTAISEGDDITSTGVLNTLRSFFDMGDMGELKEFMALEGDINKWWGDMAQGSDSGGNVNEGDALFRATKIRGHGASMDKRVGSIVEIGNLLQHKGAPGYRGLRSLVQGYRSNPIKHPGYGEIVKQMLGNNNITNEELGKFIDIDLGGLVGGLDKEGMGMEREGLAISLQALQNMTHLGKALTDTQKETFRAPFAQGLELEERLKLLSDIGETSTDAANVRPGGAGPMGDLTEALTKLHTLLNNVTGGMFGGTGTGSPPTIP